MLATRWTIGFLPFLRVRVEISVIKVVEIFVRDGSSGDEDADDVGVGKSLGKLVRHCSEMVSDRQDVVDYADDTWRVGAQRVVESVSQ
jgi:hypothetical protein